jgi:hypothetical protein
VTVNASLDGPHSSLFGSEGELITLRISVEPRLLEPLLETLAELDFPINPQLYHHPTDVVVEFPAYSSKLAQVRGALKSAGINANRLRFQRVLANSA